MIEKICLKPSYFLAFKKVLTLRFKLFKVNLGFKSQSQMVFIKSSLGAK